MLRHWAPILAGLLLGTPAARARPATFSDGKCSLTFPAAFQSQPGKVVARYAGSRYVLTKTGLKILDPAQHLAGLRRAQLARHAVVNLIQVDACDGLEIRREHSLSRVFVYDQTAYQAEVTDPEKQPAAARAYLKSLHFLARAATPYAPQRMVRYDAQVQKVPLQKCAENLLEISSLLTGFKIKHRRFPSALSSLHQSITAAYGYRRDGNHYLLYCKDHHHRDIPPHYPRTDDALHTMFAPHKPYTPSY